MPGSPEAAKPHPATNDRPAADLTRGWPTSYSRCHKRRRNRYGLYPNNTGPDQS